MRGTALFQQPSVSSMMLLGTLGISLLLGGCVSPPPRRHAAVVEPEQAVTAVYVYPANGQSSAQLDRDRFECHEWSVKQSGYDPSQVHSNSERVEVVSTTPPAAGTVSGAVAGAIVGAAVARPRNAGGGAVIGAVAGAMIGAAADANRQERTERIQQRYDQRHAVAMQHAQEYRRAISACLEGRGYAVK